MQIKLYGNGHSCNIPVQEIIDKYAILGLPKSLTFLVTMMMIPSVWSTLIMTSLKRWT